MEMSWLILAGFRKRGIRSADLSFLSKTIEHSSGTVRFSIPHLSGQKDNSFLTEQVVKLHEFWGKGRSPKDRYFILPILVPTSLYTMCLTFFQPSSAYIQTRPIASSAELGAALCPVLAGMYKLAMFLIPDKQNSSRQATRDLSPTLVF